MSMLRFMEGLNLVGIARVLVRYFLDALAAGFGWGVGLSSGFTFVITIVDLAKRL